MMKTVSFAEGNLRKKQRTDDRRSGGAGEELKR